MSIFDLEQEILNCWRAVDEMKALANSEASREELVEVLKGLSILYQIHFEKLFNIFELHTKEYYESRRVNQVP